MCIKNMSLAKVLLSYCLVLVLVSCAESGTPGQIVPDESGTPGQIMPDEIVPPEIFTSFEITDPTPGSDNFFGGQVIILGNGNIIVSDHNDSSLASKNGAVHLFDPSEQTLLGSVYGDNDGDRLGFSSGLNPITVLANNNYIVSSRFDDIGGIVDTASVRLISGETGMQIGAALAGDNVDDGFGLSKVIALADGNYVLLVDRDDVGGITDAGSVRLMNGATGVQIGDVLFGDTTKDFRTSSSITALANNNYVVAAPKYDANGMSDVGSVRLMNGATGVQIGSTLVGDNNVDQLGSGITALPNSNYVVASTNDAVNGLNAAGSARLMNGIDATQIGTSLEGESPNDNIGQRVTALANNNYVVSSSRAIVSGISLAGSIQLMDGVTGEQINAPLAGENADDQLALGGVIALANNHYVVISYEDNVVDQGMLINEVGSVRLMNGSTGAQIDLVLGDQQGDQLGFSGVTALTNNNYVIRSERDEVNGDSSAGSVRLISGTTGKQIGTELVGDDFNDRLGNIDISPLTNGNYVVPAPKDDVNGINNAGSVRLMNGATGVQIGSLLGKVSLDFITPGITALANSNYVVILPFDDANGTADTGSVRLMNGATNVQIGDTILGTANGAGAGLSGGDLSSAFSVSSDTGNFYILAAPSWDNIEVDSGLVRLIAQ